MKLRARDLGQIVTTLDREADTMEQRAIDAMDPGSARCLRVYVGELDGLAGRMTEAMSNGVVCALMLTPDQCRDLHAALSMVACKLWDNAADSVDNPEECSRWTARAESIESFMLHLLDCLEIE